MGAAATCVPSDDERAGRICGGIVLRVLVEQQDPDHHREGQRAGADHDRKHRRTPATVAPAIGWRDRPGRLRRPLVRRHRHDLGRVLVGPGGLGGRREGRRPWGRAGIASFSPQEGGDLTHRPAQRRVAGHRGGDERRQPAAVLEPRRLLVHDPVERAEHVVAHVVRRPAGHRVVRGRAQRPHVAGAGGQPPGGDLGCDVGGRPGHQAGGGERGIRLGPGDPEVGQLHVSVGGDQDVGGFDVAVDHAGLVRGTQRLRGLREERRGLGGSQPALGLDVLGEVHPLDVLHHQPFLVALVHEVEDGHHMRVVDPRRDPGFALRAHQVGAGPTDHGPDPLDRDQSTQHLVAAEPHRAHAAPTELPVE